MSRWLPLALPLLTLSALAQTPGSCEPGHASGTLDINNVTASFPTTGTLFYGRGFEHAYYVPKSTRLSPLYAAAVWIGGTVGGEFRVAGATYGQGGTNNDYFEFWPGPLNDDGALPNPNDCSAYDRVWVVSVQLVDWYEHFGYAWPDLREWPVGLGAPAVDADGEPVEPSSRDQVIDLAAEERPVIYGSQTAFWVMNDVGNLHRTTDSKPLGIEVAVSAFAIADSNAVLDQATFLRYAITNRNVLPIEGARVGFWADPDLGNAGDDYVSIDTTRSLGYVYNADAHDEGLYGSPPPAWGVDVIGGLRDDEDQKDATAFVFFSGGDHPFDPGDAKEYERVMRGVWPDGTPITASGRGYNSGGDVTTYVYPGQYGSFWSEENNGFGRSRRGDRRFILSTGPGTIESGQTRTVDFALLFAQGENRFNSVEDLKAASDLVQALYDDGRLFQQWEITRPPIPPPPTEDVDFVVGPNPASDGITAFVRLPESAPARFRLFDALGRVVADQNSRQWPAGETPIEIDTDRLAPGVYTAVLDVHAGPRVVRRLTVVR